MTTLHEARTALADAVSTAGLNCLPYPTDNPSPPIAFVDDLALSFESGGFSQTFCLPGVGTATIVSVAQRHDREGSTQFLEGLLPDVLEALHAIPGLRVLTASSGSLSIAGESLPATTVTTQFPV